MELLLLGGELFNTDGRAEEQTWRGY